MDDQPLKDSGREPGEAQEAADVAVGEALIGGEIGERGDVAARQPLPPAAAVAVRLPARGRRLAPPRRRRRRE